jgi:hypothetical protein
VVIPADHSKSSTNPTTTSRVIGRLSLLDNLIKARRSADRSQADRVLVDANRWLRRHPFDVRIMEARDRLRAVHPVNINDTSEYETNMKPESY